MILNVSMTDECERLPVSLVEQVSSIELSVVDDQATMDVGFIGVERVTEYVSDKDPYEGAYVVVPSTGTQTLDTDNKYMTEDVTIGPIPIASVSNASGGRTVTIGR